MDQVMDLDSPATWARVIADRAILFKRVMRMAMENLSIAHHPILFKRVMRMAMENLSIAHHRDTLQYAHTQGGSYKPKVR
jgi:hypothetical protein